MSAAAAATLPGLLAERAAEDPNGIAAVFGDEAITYAALEERGARIADGLHALGVRAGDAVAVWLPNRPEWLELQFALARLGAVLICVNTRYRSHDLGGALTRAGARWLVLQPSFRTIDFLAILGEADRAPLDALDGVIVCDDDAPAAAPVAGRPTIAYTSLAAAAPGAPDAAAPDQVCVAFTSSGSTGLPKLIGHAQRGIVDHARAVAGAFFAAPDTVALVALPLSGVFGSTTFMGALAAGRPAIVMEAFDAAEAVALIERHAVTTVTGPDEIMVRLIEAADPPARIASWREGGFSYQAFDSAEVVARGDALGITLFQCYGSSEGQGLMARQPRDAPPEDRALGGGVPASPRTRVRAVAPETGAVLAHGEAGLLEIAGPNLMAGYRNQPEATAAAFTADGWFQTGDLGYTLDETPARFVFLSRANDVLRLAGFLVEPREIEVFVERLDAVAAAQVVQADTEHGPRPVAFVIAAAGERVDEDAVIAHCAASLAKYKVPVRVFAVDAFPTTNSANGAKVQRARLRDRAHQLLQPPTPARTT